jgi:hypothetical protein
LSDSPAKQRPEEGNTQNSISRLPNQIDDITFVERIASESSLLSSKRQRAVAALPPVLFNVNDRHLNNTFDREFLKVTLGKPIAARSVLSFVIFDFMLTLHQASIWSHQESKPSLHIYVLRLTITPGVRQEPGTMALYLSVSARTKVAITPPLSAIFSLDSQRL